MIHRRRLSGFVLALATAGCVTGSAEAPRDPFDAAASQDEEVFLTVENNHFQDANIFAHWDGIRRRVGMVTGKTTETFQMKWVSERVQLEIDFVGGGGYRTESVDVWQGDHLNFVIMPGL